MLWDRSQGVLGHSWALLGRSWGAFGRSWGALGALLGGSWALLGRFWGALVVKWALLGALGVILGRFGVLLGRFFGRCWGGLGVFLDSIFEVFVRFSSMYGAWVCHLVVSPATGWLLCFSLVFSFNLSHFSLKACDISRCLLAVSLWP